LHGVALQHIEPLRSPRDEAVFYCALETPKLAGCTPCAVIAGNPYLAGDYFFV
jgi:hypothetical protein